MTIALAPVPPPVRRRRGVVAALAVAGVAILIVAGMLGWRPGQPDPLALSMVTRLHTVRLTVDHPKVGASSWLLEITDPRGRPAGADRVLVEPAMTRMGHAVSPVTAIGAAPGRFRVANVVLPMSGQWDLTVTITAAGVVDRIVFPVLITG